MDTDHRQKGKGGNACPHSNLQHSSPTVTMTHIHTPSSTSCKQQVPSTYEHQDALSYEHQGPLSYEHQDPSSYEHQDACPLYNNTHIPGHQDMCGKVLTHAATLAAKKYVVRKSFESRDKFVENLSLSILERCHIMHHFPLPGTFLTSLIGEVLK